MSSLAQDEVRKLSSRVKFGLERSVKDGKLVFINSVVGGAIDTRFMPAILKGIMSRSLFCGRYSFRSGVYSRYAYAYRRVCRVVDDTFICRFHGLGV